MLEVRDTWPSIDCSERDRETNPGQMTANARRVYSDEMDAHGWRGFCRGCCVDEGEDEIVARLERGGSQRDWLKNA